MTPQRSLALVATMAWAVAFATTPGLAAKKAAQEPAQALSGPAMLAVVSIRDQRISVYDAHGGAIRARVSSGQTEYETPVGVYSILQKNRDHYSNLYDDAQMPFMQRLTWSGIALHAGALPGYPASHGCVRMPYAFAEQLFPLSKIGTRVIVARDDVAPIEISHAKLWKPTVPAAKPVATPIAYEQNETAVPADAPYRPDLTNWPERKALLDQLMPDAKAKTTEAEALAPAAEELKKAVKTKTTAKAKTSKAVKSAERAKAKADSWNEATTRAVEKAKNDSARKRAEKNASQAATAATKAQERMTKAQDEDAAADAELKTATDAYNEAEGKRAAAAAAALEARGKTLPVSVFVSLETQRIYVRQGHEQVLEAPVTIANPEVPIGTHVFTAVDYMGNGDDVRWLATTLRPRAADDYDDPYYDRRQKRTASAVPPSTEIGPVTSALDRVTISPDVQARVSQYVWPGSSLIISDEAASKETGNATDFVVLISGEPQGGIKSRPKQQPDRYYDDYYYSDRYYYNDRYYERRRRPPSSFFSFW
jgi:hypothetical protein